MTQGAVEKKCQNIRVVISDVDGVMTDGGMYYSENGDELKKFNVRDGVGVILLQLSGLKVGAFTGEGNKLIERRAKKIGMDFIFCNVQDKYDCLEKFLSKNNFSSHEVAYIGDDINDLCLIGKVGLFITVSDANPDIKSKADLILETKGGEGALRDAGRIILQAQGKLSQAIESYMSKRKSQ